MILNCIFFNILIRKLQLDFIPNCTALVGLLAFDCHKQGVNYWS